MYCTTIGWKHTLPLATLHLTSHCLRLDHALFTCSTLNESGLRVAEVQPSKRDRFHSLCSKHFRRICFCFCLIEPLQSQTLDQNMTDKHNYQHRNPPDNLHANNYVCMLCLLPYISIYSNGGSYTNDTKVAILYYLLLFSVLIHSGITLHASWVT